MGPWLLAFGGLVTMLAGVFEPLGIAALGFGRVLLISVTAFFGLKFLPGANETTDILKDSKTMTLILVVATAALGLWLGRLAQRRS